MRFAATAVACLALAIPLALAQQPCPSAVQVDNDGQGHFISASISWHETGPNTVMFEINSAWRRKFNWPCRQSGPDSGFNGPDGFPGLGQKLPIVGLATTFSNASRLEREGHVATKFKTGDGKEYDLMLQVTSYSIQEDWLAGTAYVEHTYETPYGGKEPFFPPHYVASTKNKDTQQPYKTKPWDAELVGCCRMNIGLGESYNFKVATTVDLSDHIGSPRIVSLPQIFVRPAGGTAAAPTDTPSFINFCALSRAGPEAFVSKSGGTINYDSDDNTEATYSWRIVHPSDGKRARLLRSDEGGVSPNSGRCQRVRYAAPFGTPDTVLDDYIVLEVRLGNALATLDVAVRVQYGQNWAALEPEPWSCRVSSTCEMDLALGKQLPYGSEGKAQVRVEYEFDDTSPLELRYVFASSHIQTSLLSTTQGAIQFSATEAGRDHAGLPGNAVFSAVDYKDNTYVTGIAVIFAASDVNTRPQVDLPISNMQRDYVHPEQLGSSWHHVEGSDFNSASGGATVAVWKQHMPGGSAITDLVLASAADVHNYMDKGFEQLDRNLLEQSGRGEIYIMYKRGSGPAVLDIAATPMSDYKMITATSDSGASASLYVKYDAGTVLQRDLIFEPCTGQDEEVIFCASAATGTGSMVNSTTGMECFLIDVVPKPAPFFRDSVSRLDGHVYEAVMGKELTIQLEVVLRDMPITGNEDVPVVRFTQVQGMPEDQPGVSDLLTGRTPNGASIDEFQLPAAFFASTGQDGVDNPIPGQYLGNFRWTPSPYQGGWEGNVCMDACVQTNGCPARPGADAELCTRTCFPIKVHRCKWSLLNEDSFVEIAPRFQTSWVQLWYLNPGIGHPDYALTVESGVDKELNVGRLYTPRWDDTPASVAQRFGMPLQRLHDLNADLIGLAEGQFATGHRQVCVIPDSCSLLPLSNTGLTE